MTDTKTANDKPGSDHPAADKPAVEEHVSPPPPKPLDPPQVFFAAESNYPPRVVTTQEAADALDKEQWISAAIAPKPKAAEEPKFPQVWYNINVPPKIIESAADAKALGADWRKLDLPESMTAPAATAPATHDPSGHHPSRT